MSQQKEHLESKEKELVEQIEHLKQQIEKIQTEQLQPIQSLLYELRSAEKQKKEEIEEEKRELECQDLKLSDITDQTLDTLPLSKIHQLVKALYGVHKLIFSTSGTEISQILDLTPLEYRTHVIHRIRFDVAKISKKNTLGYRYCKYCHHFLHTINDCQMIKTFQCSICHQSGHLEKKCTLTVAELLQKQPELKKILGK